MPSLNNVCRWNGTKWVLVSPEEAIKEEPYGCPVKDQKFICELCGQYVSFVSGPYQAPHFRHSSSEKSKDCEERTHGMTLAEMDLAHERHLPLKIENPSSENFSFALGFPQLPTELFEHISMIHISGTTAAESQSYSIERLAADRLTYLAVGQSPSAHYDIRVKGADASLSDYWPKRTCGATSGTLFAKSSGRMLPPHSDVSVEETYYLLHNRSISWRTSEISVRPLTHRYTRAATWRIYEICAHSYSESVAQFFLELEGYRLTNRPISLQPIFPPCPMVDTNLHFCGDCLVFHMRGDGRVQTRPRVQMTEGPCDADSKLLSLHTTENHLRVLAGHMSSSVEFDCWRETETFTAETPHICVTDDKGVEIQGGLLTHLPGRLLRIRSSYDGCVILRKDGVIAAQEKLAANKELLWERLSYDTEIQVVVGCDILWELRLERHCPETKVRADQELLYQLQRDRGRSIKVPYHLARLLTVLKEYPGLCIWMRQCIQRGWISERAYKKLRCFVDSVRAGGAV